MKKVLFLIIGLGLLAGLIFGGKYLLEKRGGKKGALKVTSIPQASIFLDAKSLGRTPYEKEKIEAGEYTLKLVPEDGTTSASSWQGKITIKPNVLTVVNRELGETDLSSAGEILTLEKIGGKESEVAITSAPEGAKIVLDGQEKGASPLILKNIEPGEHEVSLSSPGFASRTVKVKTTQGYRLIANFQLALISEEEKEPAEEGKEKAKEGKPEKPYVKILDTPTGWLRVREEPTTAASEAAKVDPGQTFPFLDEESGWFKIEYETGKQGWVSGQYAEKVE